jgi:acylglycerol lipase
MSTIQLQDGTQQPRGVRVNEATLAGAGGQQIFTRSWRPAVGQPLAMVVIVPGFLSHSGYYTWVGERLAAGGLATHALDLRGRGKSNGERFYVETFDDYVDDVRTIVASASAQDPGLPVFMLGHSAGGVVGCLYALEHASDLAGLICESFAYQLPAPDLALTILKGLSHLAPHAHVLKLAHADFSRDPAVVAAMDSDPLIAGESQPAQTVAAMVRADERLSREFPLVTLPLLIMHGRADKAAKPSGSQRFYELAGSTDKTLELYEGGFHDLLNDLDKERVLADIARWIAQRIPQRLAPPASLTAVAK